MKIIEPGYTILRPQELTPDTVAAIYSAIATAARTCYQSTGDNDAQLVKRLVASGHDAMLEHATMTVRFTVDRGVSHELVRHRIASFAQESTRYCNYSKGKFGREITVVQPPWLEGVELGYWRNACEIAEKRYLCLIDEGVPPEIARGVLPTSLKTEIVVTANMREWRTVLKLRADKHAHPQMREVMIPLLDTLYQHMPELFGDIWEEIHAQTD